VTPTATDHKREAVSERFRALNKVSPNPSALSESRRRRHTGAPRSHQRVSLSLFTGARIFIMSGLSEVWSDEIGRCYCEQHRRERCHECCLDFTMTNPIMEEQAGLRKPKTNVETLCEQKVTLEKGIAFMLKPGNPGTKENLDYHRTELKRVTEELEELARQGKEPEIHKAMNKAIDQTRARDAEMDALSAAHAQLHPGSRVMEYGGAETQKLYEQFAAKPPSAESVARDPRTCSYCHKASSERLKECARCHKAYYCDKSCQTDHYKAHRQECKRIAKAGLSKEDKAKLPLTWSQLEAYGGQPAEAKNFEVRFLSQEAGFRLIALCKDREGIVKRVAAYTNSRTIPNFKPGSVMTWRNPRFHWFMDGSSGARIEEEDLANITIQ